MGLIIQAVLRVRVSLKNMTIANPSVHDVIIKTNCILKTFVSYYT